MKTYPPDFLNVLILRVCRFHLWYLFESVVSQFVLVAHVHFEQQGAVCSQGRQRRVAELLAAVRCVLLQAGAVGGQRGHPVVVNPSAVGDVNLCYILPPRGDFHQEIVIYL